MPQHEGKKGRTTRQGEAFLCSVHDRGSLRVLKTYFVDILKPHTYIHTHLCSVPIHETYSAVGRKCLASMSAREAVCELCAIL